MATTDAEGETLGTPEELSSDERRAVEALLYRLADDELVIAERYTEWQVRSPTLESDLALSNVAQDELGHARLWYDLLEDFGHTQSELVYERDPADFRQSTLVELPFEGGDWADAVVRGYLYDVAEDLRLEALEGTSYPRIADRVGKIRGEEDYHLEHAQSWLERLTEEETGRGRVQAAVDRLFPHALTVFEPVDPDTEAAIDDLGLRTRSLAEMGEDWLSRVVPFLESLGVETPVSESHEVTDDLLPDAVGRDGNHTEHWPALHAEMTEAYRELGRTDATRIMKDPDDE